MDQLSFASLDFVAKKKRPKAGRISRRDSGGWPWGVLEALIEPHYPKLGPKGGAGDRFRWRRCCASISMP